MSELTSPLDKEIADIETMQLQSAPNYFDGYIYQTALRIAEARQKFEKKHPGRSFSQRFRIGFADSKDLVTIQYHDGQWHCFIRGYEKYGEKDVSLVSLLNKFYHVH
ncbi:MAG TPA: hypothetical protein PLI45_03185 [Candidatus Woesebacteria bacterium]|nr:hypothetical protein [Candidatus Woesebacteria bacterium]